MAYYLLIEAEVLDADRYAVYREAVTPVIAQYGGRFLVRGGEVEVFEGEYNGRRRVVIEFDSKEAARGFWDSPEVRADKEAARGRGHRWCDRDRGRVTAFYQSFGRVFDQFSYFPLIAGPFRTYILHIGPLIRRIGASSRVFPPFARAERPSEAF